MDSPLCHPEEKLCVDTLSDAMLIIDYKEIPFSSRAETQRRRESLETSSLREIQKSLDI
jgi:hypothetical protein